MKIRCKYFILRAILVSWLLGLVSCSNEGIELIKPPTLDTALSDKSIEPITAEPDKSQFGIQVNFEPVDVGQLEDYEDFLEWPHYAIISGIRADGSEAWSVTTDKSYGLELSNWCKFGTAGNLFYYTNYSTIFALEVETGKPAWENSDIQKVVTSDNGYSDYKIGENGELFICDGVRDSLLVIDASGKTLFFSSLSDDLYVDAQIVNISYLDDSINVTTRDYVSSEREYCIILNDRMNNNQEIFGLKTRLFIKSVDSKLNLRALPQHDSTLAGYLQDNTIMYFYGETGQGLGSDGVLHEWYKVVVNQELEGWVRSDLVQEVFFAEDSIAIQ